MGAQGAVGVIHARTLAAADDPVALRQTLINDYRQQMMHQYFAAERGLVDDIVDPAQTRATVARTFQLLRNKRILPIQRKHGNAPG
jgi:acetyl-CoA carboxylase carboxyltransferase component